MKLPPKDPGIVLILSALVILASWEGFQRLPEIAPPTSSPPTP